MFLPFAESIGLLGEMDIWSLFTACAEAVKWKHQGFGDLRVCVNVSPIQLARRDFPLMVEEALAMGAPFPRQQVTQSRMLGFIARVLRAIP
jgi:EAL domain-containing protein (putative c-di-GMP-specific phosphodiesterase class I)